MKVLRKTRDIPFCPGPEASQELRKFVLKDFKYLQLGKAV